MAVAEWVAAETELERRCAEYGVFRLALPGMLRFIELARADPLIVETHPTVSLAAIVMSGSGPRRISVSWGEDGYRVCFVAPRFELSRETTVDEAGVLRVVRNYVEDAGLLR
jgi:hypothetical protein